MNRIFFGGLCALSLTLGISRFTYTPLLPVMQQETFLGVATGGILATIHYLGYFTGVLFALKIDSLISREKFYFWGLFLAVVSTFMMGLAENFFIWSIARFVAGFSGASGVVIGAGLIMQWLTENTNQKPQMGKFFAGAGVGIVISAFGSIVFNILGLNWSKQWIFYGFISCFLFIPAWFLRPKLKINKKVIHANENSTNKTKLPSGFFRLLLMYFFAGFAFVVSATFTVAIVKSNPENASLGNAVWLLVGFTSIPSVLIWDWVEVKFSMNKALCFAITLHAISLLFNAFFVQLEFILIAAFLFGFSNLGVVSLTMTLAGREAPKNPGKEMARLTIAFALSLVIGPSIAGILAEINGTYFYPLVLSSLLLILGVILLLSRNKEIS
ncbi:MAG: hypothetical protein CBD16_02145 [Betaproteobacteria bacterium TMED156]|nr:MAG: hypothetical protein CBD16_02145 [Betaproteobacteria bacterium TMED156]